MNESSGTSTAPRANAYSTYGERYVSEVLPDRFAHCESTSTADQEETQELEISKDHGPGVTNNYCEVNALRLGLAAAKCSGDPGASVIEVIGDSQLLINHFTGSAVIRNPNLAAEIAEINRILRGFNGTHWQHVKRNFNKAGDRLANIAMDAKSSGRLVENANQLLAQRRDQVLKLLALDHTYYNRPRKPSDGIAYSTPRPSLPPVVTTPTSRAATHAPNGQQTCPEAVGYSTRTQQRSKLTAFANLTIHFASKATTPLLSRFPAPRSSQPAMTASNSIPKTYKQYHYTSYGAPEQVWKLVDVETKPLQSTQVRIKVAFTSINPIDYKLPEDGENWFPRTPSEEAPFVIGFDVAGTIAEVGTDVTDFAVGDAVYAMTPIEAFGGAAEYVSIDAKYVAPKPKNIDFKSAAGVPATCITSYQALITIARVTSGERVLVLGGSTSCGMFGIQLAKAVGAHVIATTSTRNFELVKSLGADQVIDYTKKKWFDVLDEHSVDVILDCGFDSQTWNNEAQKILKKDVSRFVTLTQRVLKDPVESPIGATLLDVFCVSSGADLREITTLIEKGQMKVVVDSVYPLEKLLEAANKSKAGRLSGKVIVAVADE